jgi:hypothetical protein
VYLTILKTIINFTIVTFNHVLGMDEKSMYLEKNMTIDAIEGGCKVKWFIICVAMQLFTKCHAFTCY